MFIVDVFNVKLVGILYIILHLYRITSVSYYTNVKAPTVSVVVRHQILFDVGYCSTSRVPLFDIKWKAVT